MIEERITTADIAGTATRDMEDTDRRETAEQRNGDRHEAQDEFTGPLLPDDFSKEMRSRWSDIQTGFVDDPRVAVQHADELVASAIKRLAESFAEERAKLENQWSRGADVSTEDLRQALRRYRAFFHRLLSV